ncbi:MAG: CDP-diacylglycerol--serine O-phosphatidyltransferase [Planctomycetes bacterium]|nr:CDP-diacylglycerol--serine O-phosphatidyltransferase [Planctomycetota bacterium]
MRFPFRRRHRYGPPTQRRVRAVAILPSLLTLGNAISGFAAIVLASDAMREGGIVWKIEVAIWLIFIAMIFDALDGKVARLTGAASKFGGELDSLCDVISFGLAPAYLTYALVTTVASPFLPQRVLLTLSALYLSCAAIRLARFNAENSPDEDAHQSFAGLPSPAAAGTLVGINMVLLQWVTDPATNRVIDLGHFPAYSTLLLKAIPFGMLVLGLLMVSRVRYVHVMNTMFRGHRSFASLVASVFALLLIALMPENAIPLLFVGYAASGPAQMLWQRLAAPESLPERPVAPAGAPPAAPDASGARDDEETMF